MRDPETRVFYSTPQALADAFTVLAASHPHVRLVKNQIGNLSIMDDGVYVGWVDLHTAEVSVNNQLLVEESDVQ